MQWSYASMYNWYSKQGKIRDSLYETVYAVIYDSKRPSKKDINNVEPFIKRNIIYVGESPLENKYLYPNGLFVVYDDNSSNKQWLYFVYPVTKDCGQNNSITFANHMSFCYDKSDTNKSCHFHSTVYDCQGVDDYTYRHIKDYFANKLQLPNDEESILKHPYHRSQRNFIIEIMKLPWKQIHGSGKNKTAKRARQIHHAIRNTAFCKFWNSNKVKNMTAIGLRDGDIITFSISVFVQGRTSNNRLYKSFVFSCKISDDYERLLQEFMSSQTLD